MPLFRSQLIIHADDFGASVPINMAIDRAFQEQLIDSASLMPTMPQFVAACRFVERRNLHDRIGVHLSLTAGRALTSAIRSFPRLCTADGILNADRRVLWTLTSAETSAVMVEFEAQVRACQEQGIYPVQLDTHQHIHWCWPLAALLVRIARQHNIKYMRRVRNWGGTCPPATRLYAIPYNWYLKRCGLARAEYFGYFCDVILGGNLPKRKCMEVMVHPDLNSRGELVDGACAELDAAPLLRSILQHVHEPEHGIATLDAPARAR